MSCRLDSWRLDTDLWRRSPRVTPKPEQSGQLYVVIVAGVYRLAIYSDYCRGADGRYTNHGWFVEDGPGKWVYGEVWWHPLPVFPDEGRIDRECPL